MNAKSGVVSLMAASMVGATALFAPAVSASTTTAAVTGDESGNVTLQVSNSCSEHWNWDYSYTPFKVYMKVTITSNPCGITNGVEAGLKGHEILVKKSSFGGSVHKVGATSATSQWKTSFTCDDYGWRWWNGASWTYTWKPC